jgi:hypothetical protein
MTTISFGEDVGLVFIIFSPINSEEMAWRIHRPPKPLGAGAGWVLRVENGRRQPTIW